MTLPSLLFGFVLSSLLGSLFHLWRGGKLGRLILYLLLSWVGFWGGHLLGNSLGIHIGQVGPLNLGLALVGCVLFLFAGHWIAMIKPEND